MIRLGTSTGWVVAALACASAMGQPASFMPLGKIAGGANLSRARGVSPDGRFVVGESGSLAAGSFYEAAVWDGGLAPVGIGDLLGGPFLSTAAGVSADGNWVMGTGTNSLGQSTAFWFDGVTMMSLGVLPNGGVSSTIAACNVDATIACGDAGIQPDANGGPPPLPVQEAFRWELGFGLTGLGFLPGVNGAPGDFETAKGMSADGSVIVGYGFDAGGTYRPWRWTQLGGMVDISGGGSAPAAWARGCSPDGRIVVGNYYGSEPFIWTQGDGMRSLGTPIGYLAGAAVAVTNDNGRILGVMTGPPNAAAVWDRHPGIGGTWRTLQDALGAAGVSTAGWTLTIATAMSPDGRTIVGYGINPSGNQQSWKVFLPRVCLAALQRGGWRDSAGHL